MLFLIRGRNWHKHSKRLKFFRVKIELVDSLSGNFGFLHKNTHYKTHNWILFFPVYLILLVQKLNDFSLLWVTEMSYKRFGKSFITKITLECLFYCVYVCIVPISWMIAFFSSNKDIPKLSSQKLHSNDFFSWVIAMVCNKIDIPKIISQK